MKTAAALLCLSACAGASQTQARAFDPSQLTVAVSTSTRAQKSGCGDIVPSMRNELERAGFRVVAESAQLDVTVEPVLGGWGCNWRTATAEVSHRGQIVERVEADTTEALVQRMLASDAIARAAR